MGKVTVRGINGTEDLKCEVCGNWLAHWKKLAGKEDKDIDCCHPDHNSQVEAKIGAHVMINYDSTKPLSFEKLLNNKFIIPVCKEHNITESKIIRINENLLMSAEPCNK